MNIILAFQFLTGLIFSQILTSTGQTCITPSYFSYYNFNQTNFTQNNTVCRDVYSTNGTCVPINQTLVQLNNFTSVFRFNGVNAYQYIQLITNMTIYWKAYNGWVNGALNADNTFENSLSRTWNTGTNYTSNTPNWLTNVQNNALNSINTCFSNYANITIGLWCAMTSNQHLPFQQSSLPQLSNLSYAFSTSSPNIITALSSCRPLLDVYCIMSYGISISNSALPFNNTFNLSDNLVSLQTCQNLSRIANATDSASNSTRNGILLGLFNTNRILFVPDFGILNNLATFMISGKSPLNYTLPKASVVIPHGARIVFDQNAASLDFFTYGLHSNISGAVYGLANRARIVQTILSMTLLAAFIRI